MTTSDSITGEPHSSTGSELSNITVYMWLSETANPHHRCNRKNLMFFVFPPSPPSTQRLLKLLTDVDCYYVETSVSQSGQVEAAGRSWVWNILLKTLFTQAAVQHQADHRHEETEALHAKWAEASQETCQCGAGSGQEISEEEPELLLRRSAGESPGQAGGGGEWHWVLQVESFTLIN